jgi:hypothetical protein
MDIHPLSGMPAPYRMMLLMLCCVTNLFCNVLVKFGEGAVEAEQGAYNHRDYLYSVCQELSSARSVEDKIENVKERTMQEIKAEAASYLISGGVHAVSSHLRRLGFFDRPFGVSGPLLDERSSRLFQDFFESSVVRVVQSEAPT